LVLRLSPGGPRPAHDEQQGPAKPSFTGVTPDTGILPVWFSCQENSVMLLLGSIGFALAERRAARSAS